MASDELPAQSSFQAFDNEDGQQKSQPIGQEKEAAPEKNSAATASQSVIGGVGTGGYHVMVRVRPLVSRSELAEGSVVEVPSDTRLSVALSRRPSTEMQFDKVLGPDRSQDDVFDAVRSVVDGVLRGRDGTIMAYGQTGSGKTHMMAGPVMIDGSIARLDLQSSNRGLIPRALDQLFLRVQEANQDQAADYRVKVSFMEIYNEQVFDLLGDQASSRVGLELRESWDGTVLVQGLSTFEVDSYEEVLYMLESGMEGRSWGDNGINATSSRSHALFQVAVESRVDGIVDNVTKLSFVDLAGSEKVQPFGTMLQETAQINLSLSALGQCIAALIDSRRTHVPYRNSKLTRLLQESLQSPASSTVMCICLSPAKSSLNETLSSLQFADRAKRVKLHYRKASNAIQTSTPAAAKRRIQELEAQVEALTLELSNERQERIRLEEAGGLGGSPRTAARQSIQHTGEGPPQHHQQGPVALEKTFLIAKQSLETIISAMQVTEASPEAMSVAKQGLQELVFAVELLENESLSASASPSNSQTSQNSQSSRAEQSPVARPPGRSSIGSSAAVPSFVGRSSLEQSCRGTTTPALVASTPATARKSSQQDLRSGSFSSARTKQPDPRASNADLSPAARSARWQSRGSGVGEASSQGAAIMTDKNSSPRSQSRTQAWRSRGFSGVAQSSASFSSAPSANANGANVHNNSSSSSSSSSASAPARASSPTAAAAAQHRLKSVGSSQRDVARASAASMSTTSSTGRRSTTPSSYAWMARQRQEQSSSNLLSLSSSLPRGEAPLGAAAELMAQELHDGQWSRSGGLCSNGGDDEDDDRYPRSGWEAGRGSASRTSSPGHGSQCSSVATSNSVSMSGSQVGCQGGQPGGPNHHRGLRGGGGAGSTSGSSSSAASTCGSACSTAPSGSRFAGQAGSSTGYSGTRAPATPTAATAGTSSAFFSSQQQHHHQQHIHTVPGAPTTNGASTSYGGDAALAAFMAASTALPGAKVAAAATECWRQFESDELAACQSSPEDCRSRLTAPSPAAARGPSDWTPGGGGGGLSALAEALAKHR